MATWIPNTVVPIAILGRQTICATSAAIQVCHYSFEPRIVKDPTTAALKRGTGGRSSFNGKVCTVFGNSGFFGRYVCNQLGKIGTQLILPYRRDPYDLTHLKLVGDLGQVLFHPFHLRDEESIVRCIKHSNVVINLIGREYETKNFTFEDVNVTGVRTLARLAKQCGVERFIHVSCLNANPDPKPLILSNGSQYYRSKWEGELAVKEEFPEATIIRPGTVYGQEDRFLTHWVSRWRRHLRGLPVWEMGEKTEKQPIWVGDVARGIVAALLNPDSAGKTYQFVGPRRYKLSALLDWFLILILNEPEDNEFRRYNLKYYPLFKLRVALTNFFSPSYPIQNLHFEGLEIEHTTDVVRKGVPTLEDLGITPVTMESRIKWEVEPFRLDAYYMASVGEFPPVPPPQTVPLRFE